MTLERVLWFTFATSRKTIHRIVFLGRVQIRSFQGLINEKIPKKDISLRSIWRERLYVILRASPKNLFRQCFINLLLKDAEVQHDIQVTVTLNCLGFCFTKSRCSLHFVVVRLTFCSFGSTLPLRPTEIRWGTRYSFFSHRKEKKE